VIVQFVDICGIIDHHCLNFLFIILILFVRHVWWCFKIIIHFFLSFQILRGSCFECSRVAVTSVDGTVFINQMKLLDHGLLTSAMEVENFAGHFEMAEPLLTAEKVEEWVKQCISGE